jgi:hypothetical protein
MHQNAIIPATAQHIPKPKNLESNPALTEGGRLMPRTIAVADYPIRLSHKQLRLLAAVVHGYATEEGARRTRMSADAFFRARQNLQRLFGPAMQRRATPRRPAAIPTRLLTLPTMISALMPPAVLVSMAYGSPHRLGSRIRAVPPHGKRI